jgi:hypothetical protein
MRCAGCLPDQGAKCTRFDRHPFCDERDSDGATTGATYNGDPGNRVLKNCLAKIEDPLLRVRLSQYPAGNHQEIDVS